MGCFLEPPQDQSLEHLVSRIKFSTLHEDLVRHLVAAGDAVGHGDLGLLAEILYLFDHENSKVRK